MITRRLIRVVLAIALVSAGSDVLADTIFDNGAVNEVNTALDFGDVFVRGGTTVNLVAGGAIEGLSTGASVEDTSILHVLGGSAQGLDFDIKSLGDALVEISGGMIGDGSGVGIAALGNATVNIRGGIIAADEHIQIGFDSTATVNVFGLSFDQPAGPQSGDFGQVSGLLADGMAFDFLYTRLGDGGALNLVLVPEPQVGVLLALALLGVAPRRRRD